MKIGVPKEIKEQEHRVALLPSVVYLLTRLGHAVFVGRGAGAGSGFPDEAYLQAGAQILDDHPALYKQGDLIIKVKEPVPSTNALPPEAPILFTYLHPTHTSD